MEREILLLGNPLLYEISEEVKKEELELLRHVFEDMFDCIRGIRRDFGFGRLRINRLHSQGKCIDSAVHFIVRHSSNISDGSILESG